MRSTRGVFATLLRSFLILHRSGVPALLVVVLEFCPAEHWSTGVLPLSELPRAAVGDAVLVALSSPS